MTRARQIERCIADFLERDGWTFDDANGAADKSEHHHGGWITTELSVQSLASHIDAEFDRIARETAK